MIFGPKKFITIWLFMQQRMQAFYRHHLSFNRLHKILIMTKSEKCIKIYICQLSFHDYIFTQTCDVIILRCISKYSMDYTNILLCRPVVKIRICKELGNLQIYDILTQVSLLEVLISSNKFLPKLFEATLSPNLIKKYFFIQSYLNILFRYLLYFNMINISGTVNNPLIYIHRLMR